MCILTMHPVCINSALYIAPLHYLHNMCIMCILFCIIALSSFLNTSIESRYYIYSSQQYTFMPKCFIVVFLSFFIIKLFPSYVFISSVAKNGNLVRSPLNFPSLLLTCTVCAVLSAPVLEYIFTSQNLGPFKRRMQFSDIYVPITTSVFNNIQDSWQISN